VRISQPLAASCGRDEHREEKQVADEERKQQRRQRQQRRVALHPPQREQPIEEIQPRRGDEGIGDGDGKSAQVEEQRRAQQERAAHGAIQANDPEDPPA
jgi:hypothetical protein